MANESRLTDRECLRQGKLPLALCALSTTEGKFSQILKSVIPTQLTEDYMLVVAGLAYTVKAETEEEAELKLLDYLTEIDYLLTRVRDLDTGSYVNHELGDIKNKLEELSNGIDILKIWTSARQDDDERVADINQKEEQAISIIIKT